MGRSEAGPSPWTLDVVVKSLDSFPQGKEASKGSDYIRKTMLAAL